MTASGRRFRLGLAGLVFLASVLASGWRFHRIRHYEEFVDESVEMTTGWLISEGETLYGTVFSHHMPLAAAVSHAVATLSATDSPADFRAAPWVAYVLVALAIAFGPLGRRNPVAGLLSASCFLVLLSLLAPVLWAHMVLNEVFWGAAFAVFFVLLPLPAALGEKAGPIDAACAGFAAVVALGGSPLATFPIAAALVAVVCSFGVTRPEGGWLRLAGGFASGAASAFLCGGFWLLKFADIRNLLEEVFYFNEKIYARFAESAPGPISLLRAAAGGWLRIIRWLPVGLRGGDLGAIILLPVFVLMAAVIWLVAASSATRFRSGPRARFAAVGVIAGLLGAIFLLRMRGPGFHAIPLHITVAAAAVLVIAPQRRTLSAVAVTLALILSYVPAGSFAAGHPSYSFSADDPRIASPLLTDIATYVREHTSAGERISAFAMPAFVYLLARRHPATDSIFFLPWQAAWESERAPGPSTCSQLRAHAPRYVVLLPANVWNRYKWEDYASCIDSFLRKRYERVDDPSFAGHLLRRVP